MKNISTYMENKIVEPKCRRNPDQIQAKENTVVRK